MCVRYDPIAGHRDDVPEDDDQFMEYWRYKLEAATALTRSYQDEEEDDATGDVDNPGW